MKHVLKAGLAGGLLAGVMALGAAQVNAADFKLTASSSHPPVVPWVATLKNHIVPEGKKRAKKLGHNITWTEAYAGALYNFQNTLEGVQDGLGDIAWVGTLWEPNKLPLQNVTFFAPFVTDSTKIANEIQWEMHEKIPAMDASYKKYNQVFLGPQTIDDYVLITNFPVKKLSDLKGKKIYGPGAVANWIKGAGAVGVNGGLPVYYNGIKTGVAEGAIIPGTGIIPFKLHEVAPHVNIVGLGGGITGALTMNLSTYNKLPKELQDMFRKLGREYGDLVSQRVDAFKKKSFETILPAKGAKVVTLPVAEQEKWAKNLPNLAAQWVKSTQSKGLPAAEVLKAWMDGARKRGVKPLRDWDKEI